jgi:hypothetical protein
VELFTVTGQSSELDAWLAAKGWYVNKDVKLIVPGVSLECVRGGGMCVLAGETMTWFDHEGNPLTAPATTRPTGFGRFDRMTHRIMKPSPGQTVQAVSWCGRRVHEVPGRGDVDCPECLEAEREDATPAPSGPGIGPA